MTLNEMTAVIALRMLAFTSMREFSAADFDAFAGVTATSPLIGEVPGESIVLVLDGEDLVAVQDGYERRFHLTVDE